MPSGGERAALREDKTVPLRWRARNFDLHIGGAAQRLEAPETGIFYAGGQGLAEVLPTQPLCVVVGDKVGAFGAYRGGCEIIGRAASKKKELVVVDGWSHYDLYDKPEPVGRALEKLIPFYKAYL